MLGRTVETQRLLMAALRPLTGDRATGTALVKSIDPLGVQIPANCFAYPVPESEAGVAGVDDQRIIRTDSDIVATPDGVEVPVTSLLGGKRHNALVAGTLLMWDPPVFGLETHSRLVTDMSGGVDPPSVNGRLYPGFVNEITTFEDLSAGTGGQLDMFQTRLQNAIPAIIISWQSSQEGTLKGKQTKNRPDTWFIHAVSENQMGEAPRRDEAMHILDLIELMLNDRGIIDGRPFSQPPAVVQGRRRGAANTSFVARTLQLQTWSTVKTIDLRVDDIPGMTAEELGAAIWLSTSYTLETTDETPYTVVRGATYPHPQGAFSEEFSDEFDT
jgi:hypothetical protein